MATNLVISPELLDTVLKTDGFTTKKETVTVALREFTAKRKQVQIVKLFGTVSWDESFDYKKARRDRN